MKIVKLICGRLWHDIKSNYVGAVIALAVWIMIDHIFGTVCPTRLLFGVPCPGCGMTRALINILLLEFKEAFEYHLFIYVWIMFGAYCVWFRYIKGVRIRYFKQLLISIIVAMLVYYGYRMYTFYPGVEPINYTKGNLLERIIRVFDLSFKVE